MMNSINEEMTTGSQTQFAEQELLYEKGGLPKAPEPEQVAVPQTGMANKHKIMIGVAIGVVILVFVVLLAVLLGQRAGENPEELVPTPTPQSTTTDPTQKRILDLKAELEAADPAKDTLPLPLVDLELRLEKAP